ncbi:uncharacterized protein LOC126969793 isoform X3 [Leptidea sinapis]|uniref:uncharacterized protein LOC126969793 isoform X3 n=1 Tax=Leptidea sinapis TaxID=189913 RepID=UPI0021C35FDF|nr:uncharacterized protein LOC126969793 isoform X3 [Leptidea sinapis]
MARASPVLYVLYVTALVVGGNDAGGHPWSSLSGGRAEGRGETSAPAWPWQPLSVNIPIPRGVSGSTLPLVILPLPIPAAPVPPQPQTECRISEEDKNSNKIHFEHDLKDYVRSEPQPAPRPQSAVFPGAPPAEPPAAPPAAPAPPPKPQQYPSYVRPEELDQTVSAPRIQTIYTSEELVELFRAQSPVAPELPPVLQSAHDRSERHQMPELADAAAPGPQQDAAPAVPVARGRFSARDPPAPRITRSLLISGELTVPRADYTESYMAWWDANTGAARVEYYGGSTSTYRTVEPNGSVQNLEMRVDRSGEVAIRRCGRTPREPATDGARTPPALPNLSLFNFAGYEQYGEQKVERWRHVVSGRAGQAGAARGEVLTFRHDLLLARREPDNVQPLVYTVAVDSSVLGPDCDGYQHRYLVVTPHDKGNDFFRPNIELCDVVESLNTSNPEHRARLDPLAEFTMKQRDARYDDKLKRFKTEFDRQYIDDKEEAVRKNLLMQHSRFTSSGNREGATVELGLNFLGDRLDVELESLMGVQLSQERFPAERFPHERRDLQRAEPRLPDKFDWRPRGAVSPVRFQGASCASCWAFAVAGAVEGALFVKTRRLVPLSEQCLVDCAQPFGAKGCKGTWPSNAYDYVQSRGLPALDEYTPYQEKVLECKDQVIPAVTRISSHVNVTANSVPALKVAIKQHAPSVVIIDAKAKSVVFYKKGVLYDDRWSVSSPDTCSRNIQTYTELN